MDWFLSSGTRQADESETQETAHDVQQVEEAQPEASTSGSNNDGSSQQPRWRQRLVKYSIKAIQAVLLIEVAAILAYPLLSAPSNSKKRESDSSEEQGFDPADILMDYFTGRRGITALQLLSNKQLRQAVDNLVTEDFQELGVKDRGAEIRDIVEEVIRVREEGPRPLPKEDRVGLGKLGPLRFKNSTPAAKAAPSKPAAVDEQQ